MAAYLSRLHHISLHVSNAEKIANDLVSKFKFHLFASRLKGSFRQLALRKGAAVFVVNERANRSGGGVGLNGELPGETFRSLADPQRVALGKYIQDDQTRCLYDVGSLSPVDTVSNVCFEVEDVERSANALRLLGCSFLVPPTTVRDDGGQVTYTVVKSIVGNVSHTLIDRTKYQGDFLPGFDIIRGCHLEDEEDSACPITHFDHITYACPRRTTRQVMKWYEDFFGFQRFFIER